MASVTVATWHEAHNSHWTGLPNMFCTFAVACVRTTPRCPRLHQVMARQGRGLKSRWLFQRMPRAGVLLA